jgi:hypothetical protein
MPQLGRFYSHNIVNDDQRDRLRSVGVSLNSIAPGQDHLFNTYSLYQDINQRIPGSRLLATSLDTNSRDTITAIGAPELQPTGRRRRPRQDSDEDFEPRPTRRRRAHRAIRRGLPPEQQPDLLRNIRRFKEKFNKEFPDKYCVECGTLLLQRHRKKKPFSEHHVYGVTKAFNLRVRGDSVNNVILCEVCDREAQPPIDVGALPKCIRQLPQRSRKFLSPFRIDTNLGRTTGYNLSATPYLYRTLSGRIQTRTRNPRAIALYSGVIGAWLESSAHNKPDQNHNQVALNQCKDWLLQHNSVFQRNDVRANIHVDNPLPVAQLLQEAGIERRPANRPDLVVNPFNYDQETRNEHSQHHRLPAGAVHHAPNQAVQPMLFHSDPDVEVLLFPHLYPHGRGEFVQGDKGVNGRSIYTRHMDVKKKLASINSIFRDDWYWPSWAYQEIETTRIFQNTQRLINNKTRTALDGRLPQHEILQQSSYGTVSIINEAITQTIPGSIRTGESYFLGKERLVNSVTMNCGLPQLFITLTFNERWEEFYNILQHTSTRVPSNHPWEGVQYFYERIRNLKHYFWKHKTSRFGKLLELIERFEFQLRGAIHSHCLLWTEKSVTELLQSGFIRADIPDPVKEPKLHDLVMKYQIHKCKDTICGGPGKYGKCTKGFPCDPSEKTYHQPGNPRYTYARSENDIWVSPYNAELLLIWEGHCNVQFVTNEGLAAYITKYVAKGEPISTLNVGDTTAVQRHVLARRIGAMEIMVLVSGLEIFRSTRGSYFVPTTLPDMRIYSVRPPAYIEQNPDDPYYPDALEKYFARPRLYEQLTYFEYFKHCQICKKRIQNKDGPREGVQDMLGYWVYKRKKPVLLQSSYRRLSDGEVFFFVQLLDRYRWRSDKEILGAASTYRDRLFSLDPALYHQILQGQDLREQASRIAIGREYLEMVQRVAESVPVNVQEMVSQQLQQLNAMTVPGLADAAAVSLCGDQYTCYVKVTQNIQASRHQGRCFFITGPSGTGKSYLLRALQHWFNTSMQPCILMAPTGIAARNIDGSTIHSAMSIYCERGSYHTGLFHFAEEKRNDLKKKTVLIIDEVSMVDGKLLDYVSTTFAKLKENNRPFGNMHVILFGDLMQLPPVEGQKVFKAAVWKLFHPLFLKQPQRQRDQAFFHILNKIRFGIVDDEVKEALTERWRHYDPRTIIWNTTYLSSLREEADALNHTILAGMPDNDTITYEALDFENGVRRHGTEHLKVFKRGTNFAKTVVCKPGAKVMFLTNSMLADKGISNGSIGVVTEIIGTEEIEAAFPTKDGIQVRVIHHRLSPRWPSAL